MLVLLAMTSAAKREEWITFAVLHLNFGQYFDIVRIHKLAKYMVKLPKQLGETNRFCLEFGNERSSVLDLDNLVAQGGSWAPLLACLLMECGFSRRLRTFAAKALLWRYFYAMSSSL